VALYANDNEVAGIIPGGSGFVKTSGGLKAQIPVGSNSTSNLRFDVRDSRSNCTYSVSISLKRTPGTVNGVTVLSSQVTGPR